MDTNRDSAHKSQNKHNFPTFSHGLEFLNEAEKAGEKQRKRKPGISAVISRFTVRGLNQTDKLQTVSNFKGKLKFFSV